MKRFLAIFALMLPILVCGQDLARVQTVVETLADSSFFGRGYVNNGMQIASNYLQNQFYEIGLKEPEEGYLQAFEMQVNTYPSLLKLSCNGRELIPGYDFIVNPRTGAAEGTYPIRFLDSTYFQSEANFIRGDTVSIVDMNGIDTPKEMSNLFEFKQKTLRSKPVVQLENKLTWSVGVQTSEKAEVSVLKNSFPIAANSIFMDIKNQMKRAEISNVVGYLPGKRSDSILVFTAHYDHLGMMGNALFPGASDNATGTAMLLDLAQYYKENQPEYTTWFICFAAEEAGLTGSKYFVENPLFDLGAVKLLINLDLMGSAVDGIAVVNGKKYPELMNKLSQINTQKNLVSRIKLRGQAANSDHYWFAESGVPAIFIYTMGNITAYHDVFDTPEGVDWASYPEVFTLLTQLVSAL